MCFFFGHASGTGGTATGIKTICTIINGEKYNFSSRLYYYLLWIVWLKMFLCNCVSWKTFPPFLDAEIMNETDSTFVQNAEAAEGGWSLARSLRRGAPC